MSTLRFKDFIKESSSEKSIELSKLPRQLQNTMGLYVMGNKINLTGNASFMADSGIINERGELKYKFGKVATFDISRCNLTSFKNFPDLIDGNFFAYNNNFSSIDYFPAEVHGMIDLSVNHNLTSLKGLDTFLKKCERTELYIPGSLQSHLLCVMKIPGIYQVSIDDNEMSLDSDEPVVRAARIVTHHLRTDKGISACQTALLKNGLKEYAKL